MRLRMGGQIFIDVEVPLLWGTRAVIQDRQGRISVIDIGGEEAVPEVIGSQPAPGAEYVLTADGFKILREGRTLYAFSRDLTMLIPITLELPECAIGSDEIRVGTNVFQNNIFQGSGVGIVVTDRGISLGAPMPPGLAELVV